jgi:hypothetical protein
LRPNTDTEMNLIGREAERIGGKVTSHGAITLPNYLRR